MIPEDIKDMLDSMSVVHGDNAPEVAAVVTDVMSMAKLYITTLSALAHYEPEHIAELKQGAKQAQDAAAYIVSSIVSMSLPDMTETEAHDFLKSCNAIIQKVDA